MKEFVGNTEDQDLKQKLLSALEGKGAFRRFKDALDPYPAERKNWYRHNARAAGAEIRKWLNSIGIEDPRHRSAQEKGA